MVDRVGGFVGAISVATFNVTGCYMAGSLNYVVSGTSTNGAEGVGAFAGFVILNNTRFTFSDNAWLTSVYTNVINFTSPTWNATSSYSIQTIVSQTGFMYTSLHATNLNNEPGATATHWGLLFAASLTSMTDNGNGSALTYGTDTAVVAEFYSTTHAVYS